MFGMRTNSYSDYSPAFLLENMQMITDAAVRGLKVLAYTKEIDFAKVFAPTGANINLSCFAYEQNGQISMDAMQGADWAEAQALRAKYDNVGVERGEKNLSAVAEREVGDTYVVRNKYTKKEISVPKRSLAHGLDGEIWRLFSNSTIISKIGEVIQNAIPINGFKKDNKQVAGKYAMLAYTRDSEGRMFIVVLTVLINSHEIVAIETYQ